MAVKNAATNMEWGPYGTDEGLTKCETKAQNYSDISGYGNCERIRASHGDLSNYPAFRAADDYNTVCAVAGVTTGWYLPASGQWWDLLQNLGGCAMLADPEQQTSSDSGDFYWSGQGDIPAALNRWMEAIAADSKDPFADYNWFWGRPRRTPATTPGAGAWAPVATCTAAGTVSTSTATCDLF